MNELISIRENKGKQVVLARELYLSLGYDSSNYSRWVKSNIIENPYSIEQRKEAILEYLKESDEFHKLICDITGVERKQQKVSAELEKLKEEYSHMCESYENEKQQRNDLLRKCREKTVKIMKMQTTLEESCSHHNNMMNRIKDLLKEVDMPSVKHTIEALKTERANGKLLAEDNELCRRENDKLKLNYEKANKELEAQKDLVKKYVAKSEKLQSKLDRASKQYGELIKIISDKAIKSI